MKVVVVYINSRYREDSAILVYKDDVKIHEQNPPPEYGGRIEDLIFKLTGERPEVNAFKQQGDEYPDSFIELKEGWKLIK